MSFTRDVLFPEDFETRENLGNKRRRHCRRILLQREKFASLMGRKCILENCSLLANGVD